jgi:serine/threonine-protein kinase
MQKIGRYQIEGELGRGAMGIVYRAYDPAIGRRVAVKTIRLDALSDPQSTAQLRERLLREAQSAGILSHPNIVTIYDIAEDSNNAYIFMECVEGLTLDSFSRGLPGEHLVDILHQAALALDYAHAKGIVHRDIKPANLMLAGQKLKVTDFGVARLKKRDSTQSGSLLGTPSYMSPEQISGAEVTGASDQYSLAVIAYEFLAGTRPFEHENLATLLFKIAHEAPAPVASLPPRANDVLGQALAKDPVKRFPTCHAFAEALAESLGHALQAETPVRAATGDEPTLASHSAPPIPAAPLPLPPARQPFEDTPVERGGNRWVPIAAILVLLLAGGASLWYFFGPKPTPEAAATPPAAETPQPQKPSAAGEPIAPPVVTATPPIPTSPPEDAPSPTTASTNAPATASANAPATAPTTAPQKGVAAGVRVYQVGFTSDPDGAEVLINDGAVDRCRATPCTLELPAGAYRVLSRLKDFPPVSRNLRVPDASLMHFTFEVAEGLVAVSSTPAGASIRLDGREILEKTPAMLKLKPGTYRLEVSKEGMPPQSREVTVTNGTVQSLNVKWN